MRVSLLIMNIFLLNATSPKMNIRDHRSGFAALVPVLILSAVLTLLLLPALIQNISLQSQFIAASNRKAAYYRARSCIEIARMRILFDSLYQGNETIPLPENTCIIYSINRKSGNIFEITALAYSDIATTTLRMELDVVNNIISSITSL